MSFYALLPAYWLSQSLLDVADQLPGVFDARCVVFRGWLLGAFWVAQVFFSRLLIVGKFLFEESSGENRVDSLPPAFHNRTLATGVHMKFLLNNYMF